MKKTKVRQTPDYFIFPIILTVLLVPLIVHLRLIPLDNTSFQYWTGQKENADFFSFYKAAFLLVFSIFAAGMLVFAKYKGILGAKKLTIYYVPIAVYAGFIILSTVLSKFPATATSGFVDRYEGMYVLLAYLVMLVAAVNLVNNEKQMKIIIISLFISATIIGLVGIFQFFGLDFFKNTVGKFFILPSEYRKLNLDFTFGPYTIYSTLYNTNYVGSYMAMLLPLALVAFLYVKTNYAKAITGLFTCLMYANWIGCQSRAGYIAGAIAILFLVVLLRRSIMKNMKSAIILFLSFIIIFAAMDTVAGGVLGGRIISSVIQKETNLNQNNEVKTKAKRLKDIIFSEKKVSIIYGEDTLNMGIDGNQVQFTDTKGDDLTIQYNEEGRIIFNDTRYSSYSVQIDKSQNLLDVKLNAMYFILYAGADGFKILGERNELVDKLQYPESFGFKGKEKFGSMRGYIWSRSIPLLKNNIIFGGGPDTYVMQFPQRDYIGKLIAFDRVNEIVDKPHNVYLQIAINTGCVSLIAFLFLIGVYLLSSWKLYIKKKDFIERDYLGIAFSVAILGYVVAGLANDSLVSVAPVFWVLLGLGISCNYLGSVEQQQKH